MRPQFLTELFSVRRRALVLAGLAVVAVALACMVGPLAALPVCAAGALIGLVPRPAVEHPARLKVRERRALGSGGELWLVEVDGRTVLVACGQGFAAIRPLRPGASP